jgi:hypothetical protein
MKSRESSGHKCTGWVEFDVEYPDLGIRDSSNEQSGRGTSAGKAIGGKARSNDIIGTRVDHVERPVFHVERTRQCVKAESICLSLQAACC